MPPVLPDPVRGVAVGSGRGVTGIVVVLGIVLRWAGRCLLRVAEWIDPAPELEWFVLDEGEMDAEIVPLYGRSRRA